MAIAQFSGQYGHNMTLEVWSDWNRQDVASNSSTVNVQARLRTNGYASVWGVTAPVTVTVNGNSESLNVPVNIGTNSSFLFYGKDFVVPHNGDGTKTVDIKISVSLNFGGYGSSTAAFSLPLPTIPRASTVNDVTGTLGSAMAININRKNSAFKHTVKYNFGSLSGTIATNVDTFVSWTPPLSLATAMPSKTSDLGDIIVETYSGSSKIGSATCRLTLNVPDSVKPTLGSITLTDSNTAVKNLLNTANTFVQVMSNIQVAFNGASGAYGSTISSYRAEIVGKNQSTNSNNGSLGMLNFNGAVTIRATVTDSRGRTSEPVNVQATVLDYFTPQLSFTAQRSGSDSTTVTVTRNARVAPLTVGGSQKNKMKLTFKYKEHSSTSYTADTGSANGTWTTISSLTNSSAILGATFSVLKSYDVIGTIEDSFTSYEFLITIGTESFPLALRVDRVGIGKLPEQADAIDSAWQYYYDNKPIQHHQLSANDGTAIRLPDGADLDTVTECGFYTGKNLLHAPVGDGAHATKYIRVSKNAFSGYALQESIDVNGVVSAFRVQKSGAWDDWQYYAVQNKVAEFTSVNQTKVYTKDIAMPGGLVAAAHRIGNLVTLTLKRDAKTLPVCEYATQSGTVPSGYRPTAEAHLSVAANDHSNVVGSAVIHIASDGTIRLTNGSDAIKMWTGTVTYLTSDQFPS